jgi:hypothetical protein
VFEDLEEWRERGEEALGDAQVGGEEIVHRCQALRSKLSLVVPAKSRTVSTWRGT